jgi:hypothetical protein
MEFFNYRIEELLALGTKDKQRIFDFIDGEVFGLRQEQASTEQKRQRDFSATQLQAIKERAAREKAEEGSSGSGSGEENAGGEGEEGNADSKGKEENATGEGEEGNTSGEGGGGNAGSEGEGS